MSKSIKHFMWGYQPHFQSGTELALRSLLRALDLPDECNLFVVGVCDPGVEGTMPGCVEPEVNHWAQSEWFYDAYTEAKQVAQDLPEAKVFHSHPVAQENADRRRLSKAIRLVVNKRLQQAETKPAGSELFTSFPILRDRHWVMLVAVLPTQTIASVPMMAQRVIHEGEYDEYEVPNSILEAVVESLFSKATQELHAPDAGAGLSMIGSTDGILRRAGVGIVNASLAIQTQDYLHAGEGAALLDAIERLSWTPYESVEAQGDLALVRDGFDAEKYELQLIDPIPMAQSKSVRKLLSLTNSTSCLVVQQSEKMGGRRVIGLAASGTLPPDAIRVLVRGRSDWEWSTNGRALVRFRNGLPEIPVPDVDVLVLGKELMRRFPEMPMAVADRYASIGAKLAESDHGALLVVVENAESEAKRLERDGMRINPKLLNANDAERFACIDGATLCDSKGVCHAIGVILDGLAVADGDRGRGSRYNSSLRYVQSLDRPAAAMICSEDGGLTLVPMLMPQLESSKLEEMLTRLRNFAESPSSPPDFAGQANTIDWLEKKAYYLTAEQCDQANAWIDICEQRRKEDVQIHVVRRPLKPSSKFLPERDLI